MTKVSGNNYLTQYYSIDLGVVAETPAVPEGSKNRYERLENRISQLGLHQTLSTFQKLIDFILDELETLLQQKENGSISERESEFYSDGKGSDRSVGQHRVLDISLTVCLIYLPCLFMLVGSNYIISPQYTSAHDIDTVPANSHISHSPPQPLHAKVSSISEPTPSSPSLEMMWTTRPSSLPGPELLRHLYVELCVTVLGHQCPFYRVDVFFKFHPHAGRLFHATSFINSLSLPPTHPRFPSIPVLHAICAIGSFYTAAVTSPPLPDFNHGSPGTHSGFS